MTVVKSAVEWGMSLVAAWARWKVVSSVKCLAAKTECRWAAQTGSS